MFTDDLRHALATARSEAHRLRHNKVRPEHLALGILRTATLPVAQSLADNSPEDLAAELEQALQPDRGAPDDPFDLQYTKSAKAVIERAMLEAHLLGTDHVACEHLLIGVLSGSDAIARAPFVARGIDAARVRNSLAGLRGE